MEYLTSTRERISNKLQKLVKSPRFKGLIPYALITFFGLIVCLPVIDSGVLQGHDLLFHVYRDHSVLNSLKDGQIVPQVDPQALDGFGYSWNMFYGPLVPYITTVLRFVSVDWSMAINMFIIVAIIGSGIFLYRFIFDVTKEKIPALFAAFIYMAAPYHLLDIYVRQAQGELLPFVFAPILFHGLYRIVQRQSGTILVAVGFAGILLSHNISALLFAAFAALYLLLNIRSILTRKAITRLGAAGLIVVGLTAFFTIPLLELKQAGIYAIFDKDYMTTVMGTSAAYLKENALSIDRLFFNAPTVTGGGSPVMPFALGLITFIGGIALFFGYKKMPRTVKVLSIQALILAAISLLLTTNLIPWSRLPSIFYTVQFPWRFMMVSVLFLSIAAAFGLYYGLKHMLTTENRKRAAIIAVALLSVISSLEVLRYAAYSQGPKVTYDYSLNDINVLRDQWIDQYSPVGLYKYTPAEKTADRFIPVIQQTLKDQPKKPVVAAGDSEITEYGKVSLHSSFMVDAKTDTIIVLPFVYYPGYYAYTIGNGGKSVFLKTEPSKKGFLKVTIPEGTNGLVHTDFGLSAASLIGVSLTGLTVVSLLGIGAYRRLQRHSKR